MSISLKTSL